jgi:hypothetical protein
VLQLDASVRGGEAPIGFGVFFVAALLPRSNFCVQRFFVWDAAVQALRRKDTQLGFGHIQPTAMLGCVVPFEAFSEPPGLGGREGFVKRGLGVRVEIVLNQHDLLGPREVDVR